MAILWDHGGGTVGGYGRGIIKETGNKERPYVYSDAMSIDDIQYAFKKAGYHFDVIGFDACLMATMETAYSLKDCADYLVASEEYEWGYGWAYTDWLNKLSKNSSMKTVDICTSIVDSYINSVEGYNKAVSKKSRESQTLSVMDLSHADEAYAAILDYFAKGNKEILLGKGGFNKLSYARETARAYGDKDYCNQIDLVDYLEKSGLASEKEAMNSFCGKDKLVVYEKSNYDGSNGVAFYLPDSKNCFNGSYQCAYKKVSDMLKKVGYGGDYFLFFDSYMAIKAKANGYNFQPQAEPVQQNGSAENAQHAVEANPYVGPKLNAKGYIPMKTDNGGDTYYVDMTQMPKEWRDSIVGLTSYEITRINNRNLITNSHVADNSNIIMKTMIEMLYEQHGLEAPKIDEDDAFWVAMQDRIETQGKSTLVYALTVGNIGMPALLLDLHSGIKGLDTYSIPVIVNGRNADIYACLDARSTESMAKMFQILGYTTERTETGQPDFSSITPFAPGDEVCPVYLDTDMKTRIDVHNITMKISQNEKLSINYMKNPFMNNQEYRILKFRDAYGKEYLTETMKLK